MYFALYTLTNQSKLQSSWINFIQNILISTGFDCIWENQNYSNKDTVCKHIIGSIKQMYVQNWKQTLEESNKCCLYKYFKTEFIRERYINQLPDTYVLTLFQFRCGNHKLQIEMGRRMGVCRENRICKECNLNMIGDEFHFVLECPKYSTIREQYVPKRYIFRPSVFKFCQLYTAGKNILLRFCKFLKAAKVL